MSKRRQAADLDSPWKEGLDYFLSLALQLLFPRVHAGLDWACGYEALDQELRQLLRSSRSSKRTTDKLYRVWRRDGREARLYIHLEVQGRREKGFGQRMFECHYRIFDRYGGPVVSLAILCDDRPRWRPDRFGYNIFGCSLRLKYPVVKLLDWRGREAELESNPNPFAQVVLAHLRALETRGDPAGRGRYKIQLVKRLYERGWSAEDVRQLFRLIDWLLELPPDLQQDFRRELHAFEEGRQVPYVTSIERLAKAEGREEGARETYLELIQAGLKRKFGAQGTRLMPKVRAVDELPQLRALAESLMGTDSLQAFRELLER
jgi:hypothetical protein